MAHHPTLPRTTFAQTLIMKALVFHQFGGPEVLRYEDVPDPVVQPGSLLVAQRFIGLNFADIYRRRGNYHLQGQPPYIAGYEGAGVVIDANGVPGFQNGDRIGFADVPFANAERIAVPADHALPLPDDTSFETAAAALLQGLTAQYLVTDSHGVQGGETVLIHAAAGGVGGLLTQLCKARGARVIGLSTSEEKLAAIRKNGADAAFHLHSDWMQAVRDFTGGHGVDVVYDSVGSTLGQSLDLVKIGGKVVFYGMSGGDPAPVDPRYLMDGSKTLTGGDLWSYLTSAEERRRRSDLLFSWIRDGMLRLSDPVVFTLSEGAAAHRFLESGQSAGKVLLRV